MTSKWCRFGANLQAKCGRDGIAIADMAIPDRRICPKHRQTRNLVDSWEPVVGGSCAYCNPVPEILWHFKDQVVDFHHNSTALEELYQCRGIWTVLYPDFWVPISGDWGKALERSIPVSCTYVFRKGILGGFNGSCWRIWIRSNLLPSMAFRRICWSTS